MSDHLNRHILESPTSEQTTADQQELASVNFSQLPTLQPLPSVQLNQVYDNPYRGTPYLSTIQSEQKQLFVSPRVQGQHPSSSMAASENFEMTLKEQQIQKAEVRIYHSETTSSSMEGAARSFQYGSSRINSNRSPTGQQRMYRGKPCYSAEEKKRVRAEQNRAAMKRSREKRKLEEAWRTEELDLFRRQVSALTKQREDMMQLIEDSKIMTRDEMIKKWPMVESKQAEKVKIKSIID